MSLTIASRIKKVKPSITLAVTAKAAALKAAGEDIISFGAGEPDFGTPENIKNAGITAIQKGLTKYTVSSGIVELKKAVQAKLKRENNLDYELNQIMISCGAKHSLYNVIQAIVDKDDEVIIPSPYWVSYPDMVLLADGKPVIIETKESNNFELEISDLEKYITPKTKAIIINSPSNPTGSVYSKESLAKLAEYLADKDIYIISDEIYEHLLYDQVQFSSIANTTQKIKDKTIIINGVSKSYAMTGWRIGYAAGPAEVIKAMDTIQSQATSNPTSIAQYAAVEALNGSQDFLPNMLAAFDERRKYMVEQFNAMPLVSCSVPQGAFYVFPNVSKLYGKKYNGRLIANSVDFSEVLLAEAKVAVVPGAGFGQDAYIRLSYACSLDSIKHGLSRIKLFVQDLAKTDAYIFGTK